MPRSKRPTRREPVHVGHHHVENQQIRQLNSARLNRLDARANRSDCVPFQPECSLQRMANSTIILGHENRSSGAGSHLHRLRVELPKWPTPTAILTGFSRLFEGPRSNAPTIAIHQSQRSHRLVSTTSYKGADIAVSYEPTLSQSPCRSCPAWLAWFSSWSLPPWSMPP